MRSTTVHRTRQHNKLSVAAFLVLLLVSCGGVALWRMQSVQIMSVESGSMAPAIKRGDAVVLHVVKDPQLAVGDVVSYRSPADQSVIITHRVVAVEPTWKLVVTKGDNANRNDNPIPIASILGKVDARLLYGGYVFNFLRSPAGLIATVYAPALIIISLELKRLAYQYRKPTYRLAGYKIA